MHQLAWITSYPQSGCNLAWSLVTGYLVDAPPTEVTSDALLDVAPDLVTLLCAGRTVPLGDTRPYVVKTQLLPGADIMRHCQEATGKVVYVVRDPRTLISTNVGAAPPRKDPAQIAHTVAARLAGTDRPAAGHGSWPQHVREWTSPERIRQYFPNVDGVHVVRFEDLDSDPTAGLHQLIDFLDIPGGTDPDRVRRAVQTWTADTIRDAVLEEGLPGVTAFRADRVRRPALPRSTADIGEAVEAAYRQLLSGDAELAGLVERFGYPS